MSSVLAPEGQVYVCGACGKRSRDVEGTQKVDRSWDESCMLHAVLCIEESLVFGAEGRVTAATPVPAVAIGPTSLSSSRSDDVARSAKEGRG
jgi:hypothetical protein